MKSAKEVPWCGVPMVVRLATLSAIPSRAIIARASSPPIECAMM